MIDDVTGGPDEPKRPVTSRRRGLGKGLGAILPSREPPVDEQTRRDQLTGLPDRSVLDERFDLAVVRCREDGASLAVLVVALDGFSEVNELYGHNVGDALLHDAATRLSTARRRSDTVARFAGDEFVVVCPYVATSDLAGEMAARILEDLSRPVAVEGVEHQLSASIGVVVATPGDTAPSAPSLETLLGDASLAMRSAKDEGGASWKLFDPSMREHLEVRSQNRQDLRTALEEDDLVLDYEAIVDLDTGTVIGDGAVLGWRQPGPETEQPQAPLDIVDEAGLAVPIGRWVLDKALGDLRARGGDAGSPEPFRVWVKVAPSLVADPVLVEIVDELTAKHGVSPSVLGMDVREPSAAALSTSEATLRALEERDVLVALDDFGSGPTNLALIQRLPISGLKLAPDLVAALGDDLDAGGADVGGFSHPAYAAPGSDERASALSGEAASLVRGLLDLGRALELTVVAQGVESEGQVTELHALGCRYAQGPFLTGGPGPAPGLSRVPPDTTEADQGAAALLSTGSVEQVDDERVDDERVDEPPLDAPSDRAGADDDASDDDGANEGPVDLIPVDGGRVQKSEAPGSSAPPSEESPPPPPPPPGPAEPESLWAPGTLIESPGGSTHGP